MTDPISTDQDCVESFRRAVVQCDRSAREVVQQRFGEVVLGWLRRHPSREAACRLGNEEQYVARAFARFWQMSAQQQVDFQTLADVLRYLRASLNGVVLDTLRASARPGEMPLEKPGDAGELGTGAAVENESDEVWEMLRKVLPSRREQRLAYLLFHCGLKPREIVYCCPGEFSDVQDIYTLLCSVLARLLPEINDQGEAPTVSEYKYCLPPGGKGTMNTSATEVLKRKKAHLENFRQYGSDPFRVAVIHGGPGAAGEVAPIAQKLGETRGVLEPIQTARTLDRQVEELRLVVEQNATKPVIFIGHSWGAWLSYIVTARYPELVRKLILVGSGPFEEKYVKLITENRLRRLSQEEKEEYLHIVDTLNTSETPDSHVFLSRLGELARDAYDPIEIPKDTSDLDFVNNPGEIYQGVWPEAARLRRTGELLRLSENITCPVVAIHGDCDPHPAQGIQEPLAANLKDFRMIILEKCGHDPWRERHAMDTFYAILEQELSTRRP